MATSAQKILIRLTKYSGKVSTVVDATDSFNATGTYFQDLSGWDAAVVQVIGSDSAIYFKTTNDNGALTGGVLPAPEVPINWYGVLGVDLSTKNDTDNINGTGIVEFGIIGKYLQLLGDSYDAPPSFGYFLSFYNYDTVSDAYSNGISQGSQVVYATTDNAGSVQAFYYDSRLTEPVYGNDNWYGFKLITNPDNTYAATITPLGVVSVD